MKLKKIHIIFLAFGFFIFMIASVSETLLTDFGNLRREIILKGNETQTIVVSNTFWANQIDKHELVIDGMYYDVESFQINQNKMIVKVIPDAFDFHFKKITENLNKKHKLNKTKKHIEILPNNSFQYEIKPSLYFTENNFSSSSIQKNKIVLPFFHPPAIV